MRRAKLHEAESAANLRHTRAAHAEERSQDYLETIADLILQRGEARATDLARALGVTHATVVRMVQRLQKQGLVSSLPYRSIFLTTKGRKIAQQAKNRHELVVRFLESIGVPPVIARKDAEGIEHHVSEETLSAFERFVLRKKSRD
ncbi:MAG: manganese-binding transcriptional regulator MntR [Methylacidiphilales bacterium]|nr:manganese-binding transcriptional regulator MntR [Candidatus Methylacidiphilales bacterium]MDW8350174.1 manganese-binding transcriptional regulator MntR [Verrucomicrobiae bacterium]